MTVVVVCVGGYVMSPLVTLTPTAVGWVQTSTTALGGQWDSTHPSRRKRVVDTGGRILFACLWVLLVTPSPPPRFVLVLVYKYSVCTVFRSANRTSAACSRTTL
jgi:hypothetical protein